MYSWYDPSFSLEVLKAKFISIFSRLSPAEARKVRSGYSINQAEMEKLFAPAVELWESLNYIERDEEG